VSRRRAPLGLIVALFLFAPLGCGRFNAPGGGSGGGFGAVDDLGGAGHPSIGLISAVPDATRVRVEWRADLLGATPPAVELFYGTDPSLVYGGTGLPVDLEQGTTTLEGLATGQELWLGLALDEGQGLVPTGPLLRVRTAAPIHVDPGAPLGGDGSAEKPFREMFLAVLTAFSQGGGNVWVTRGTFEGFSLGLFEGVDLYGGFETDYDLATRDPAGKITLLRAVGNSTLIALDAGPGITVIDGFSFDGAGSAAAGLDIDSHAAQLRRLAISGCSRAIKLRSDGLGTEIPLQIIRCTLANSGVEGLSVDGAFHLLIEDCAFVDNAQEGIDMDDLLSPPFGKAILVVKDSRFLNNGADGLDVDLGVVPGASPSGRFLIEIEDCEFVDNGGIGMLLDHDFETFPGWSARITVRGCLARGNAGGGVRLDLDGRGDARVHRLRCDANQGDGLLLTSESQTGTVVVSSSAFVGNQGVGVRGSLGNYGVLLSHCVLAGNFQGGFATGPGLGLAVSSIAYRQPAPWAGGNKHFSVSTSSPLTFDRAPSSYHQVTGFNQGTLVLAGQAGFGVGTTVDVAEEGLARTAEQVSGNQVVVTPQVFLEPPSVLAAFDTIGPVIEDWHLPPGSPARDSGMPIPGGPAVDAGPFGAPLGGDPGGEDLVPAELFVFSGTTPPWNQALPAQADLLLNFRGGSPDPGSLASGLDAVNAQGLPLPLDPVVEGDQIRIPAPPGGWKAGDLVRLHGTLTSLAGVAFSSPLALPLDV
jgi:Right handed beta helix region